MLVHTLSPTTLHHSCLLSELGQPNRATLLEDKGGSRRLPNPAGEQLQTGDHGHQQG
jgi:hypothetical protein